MPRHRAAVGKPDHVAFLPLDYFVESFETVGRESVGVVSRALHAATRSLPSCAHSEVRDGERHMGKKLPAPTVSEGSKDIPGTWAKDCVINYIKL